MMTPFEKYCWKVSLSLLLWSVPQFALTFWFVTNDKMLNAMFSAPIVPLVLWTALSIIIVNMAFRFVGRNLPDNIREDYRSDYYDYIPWMFIWPPMQFHASILVIVRLTIIFIVRLFVEDWRKDKPYLFIDHSQGG